MRTKRIILNLTVASLAFAVGVVGSGFRIQHVAIPTLVATVSTEVPVCQMPGDLQSILNVEYCELMADPERYDGRIVRFNAVMLAQSGYEPIWDHVSLGEPRCERELWAHEQFHLTSRTCPAVLQKLDSLLMRDDPSYPRKNAKVRIVGKFFSSKWTVLPTLQDHYESERFTIISVERAASIDEDN
jgi:hypothetical protein